MLEDAARLIYEAETGRDWEHATEEDRRRWLAEAQRMQDTLHAPWPTHPPRRTIH